MIYMLPHLAIVDCRSPTALIAAPRIPPESLGRGGLDVRLYRARLGGAANQQHRDGT